MSVKVKKFKICKKLGAQIYEKCQSANFANKMARLEKKGPPKRLTDYGNQLSEKQKVRFLYGVTEKQFRNYVNKAIETKSKESTPAFRLFTSVENRLDNVVYRLGFAKTRSQSRQMVSHGHLLVNGRRIDVPSYSVSVGDIITVREGSKSSPLFEGIALKMKNVKTPAWIGWDTVSEKATVTGMPTDPDPFLNFQAVMEFYSR